MLAPTSALLPLALVVAQAVPPPEPLEARVQARLCLSIEAPKADSLAACRRALELGLSGERAQALRRLLAQKLADRLEWDAVVLVQREIVRDSPQDADAWRRLGQALLYGVARPAEAVLALRQAARLDPADAETAAELGIALNASAAHGEAVVQLERALEQDATIFERRPGAREALESARRGEVWPGAGAYQPTRKGPSPPPQGR